MGREIYIPEAPVELETTTYLINANPGEEELLGHALSLPSDPTFDWPGLQVII
jgi:hypothetical protein